jgi:hypothetical protein
MHLQGLGRGLRRSLVPELIDQSLGGDRLVGVDQKQREQGTLPLPTEPHRALAIVHFERTENAELHIRKPPGAPAKVAVRADRDKLC